MTDRGAPPSARRAGRAPMVVMAVMVVIALVPAVGFAGLWRWAAAIEDEPGVIVVTAVPDGPPAPVLTTSLASLRRTPEPLAAAIAEATFTALVDEAVDGELTDLLGRAETACLAVTRDGEPVAEVDARQPVIPASNQKLFVAAVALEVLGSDTRLVTEVRGGEITDGVLAGNLYLVGGGDPSLTSDELADAITAPLSEPTRFDALVDQLVDAGLTRIEGDVVADNSRYDDEFVVSSWGADITRDDGGPMSAILVNGGRIFGSGIGLNPAQSAANELTRLLVNRGVPVTGSNRVGEAPDAGGEDGVAVLAAVESVPVGDLVADMLLLSHNTTAEMLLKEIGYVGAGEGTRARGLGVILDHLSEWQVALSDVTFEDGSGLARRNSVPCTTVVDLLAHLGPDSELAARLPVAGESGTLTDQLVDTPAAGVVRAKTGTLTGVKALSGYFPTPTGEAFELAILMEGDGVDDPEVHVPVWTTLAELLAEYPVEPEPERFAPR